MTEAPSSITMWTAIGGLLTFLTLAVNLGYAVWKEHRADQRRARDRKWEIEDRDAREKKASQEAESIAVGLALQAQRNKAELYGQQHGHTERLEKAIAHNTEETVATKQVAIETKDAANKAYEAANNFAVKLESVDLRKEDKK